MVAERAEVNLPYVLKEFSGSLLFDEIHYIPDLVPQGLDAVCLCLHGIGRSREAAKLLTGIEKPAVCIEGGLEEFSQFDEKRKEKVIESFSKVPRVLVFLDGYEIRKFKGEIEKISARARDLKVFRTPHYERFTIQEAYSW